LLETGYLLSPPVVLKPGDHARRRMTTIKTLSLPKSLNWSGIVTFRENRKLSHTGNSSRKRDNQEQADVEANDRPTGE
jgi:hypothetical protein